MDQSRKRNLNIQEEFFKKGEHYDTAVKMIESVRMERMTRWVLVLPSPRVATTSGYP